MAKVIRFPVKKSQHRSQRIQLASLPVRQAIFEAWSNRRTGEQVANNLRLNVKQIKRVLWAYAEIHYRKASVSRAYRPEMEQFYREIEFEVWREAEQGPLVPPPTERAA